MGNTNSNVPPENMNILSDFSVLNTQKDIENSELNLGQGGEVKFSN